MNTSNRNPAGLHACVVLLSAMLFSGAAAAEDYSLTDLQILYTGKSKADAGTGTGTSDEKLTNFRFEHFGVWNYGDNYINLDYYRGKDLGGTGSGSFGGEIHQAILRLADAGLAMLVISSYLPEVMKLSDRILVARKGGGVEEFSSQEASEEGITYAAVH